MPVVPADSPAIPEAEAAVVGDEPMVDVVAQATGVETDAQDTAAKTDGDEPVGFPDGPRDHQCLQSMLTMLQATYGLDRYL